MIELVSSSSAALPSTAWSSLEERLDLYGPAALSDDELVGFAIGAAPATARRVLDLAGGLRALAAWSAPELAATGLGTGPGLALAAAFEIGRRADAARRTRGTALISSLDVYRHFRPRLRDERKERFIVALLDVKNRLLREVRISTGSLSASLVHPREAFAPAVREPAHSVIFAHNHPSGDPQPSPEDQALTKRLVEAGDILGIRVLDHVVVAADDYYSFADAGALRR